MRKDPLADMLDRIIETFEKKTATATREAMRFAELEHAPPLYRLRAVCIAMEGFLVLNKPETSLDMYDVVIEMHEAFERTRTGDQLMAQAEVLAVEARALLRTEADSVLQVSAASSTHGPSSAIRARPVTPIPITSMATEGTPSTQRYNDTEEDASDSQASTPASSLGRMALEDNLFAQT